MPSFSLLPQYQVKLQFLPRLIRNGGGTDSKNCAQRHVFGSVNALIILSVGRSCRVRPGVILEGRTRHYNAVKHFVLRNFLYSCIMRASNSEKSIYIGPFLRNRHCEMLHSVAGRSAHKSLNLSDHVSPCTHVCSTRKVYRS